MSGRTTIVLLAVLIIIAGVVYWLEVRPGASGKAAPTPAANESKLLDVSLPAIDGIAVRDLISNTQMSASRDVSGTWWLTQPESKPADPATLTDVASQLSNIYVQRVLTPTGNLGDFGLVTGTLSVEVKSAAGPVVFKVGDMTPSKGAYYVQKTGDERVYLVDPGVIQSLQDLVAKPPVALPPTPSSFTLPSPASP